MAEVIAIKVEQVSKSFKLPHEKQSSLKSAVINFRKRGYEQQEVLKDISFEIKKGEFFGIVGRNGSGKSTLLKLLAGIYSPNNGQIQINGKLTPFIELGVGFNPELTGRENVFLNGALLGFNRQEMLAMYDDIVSFAELERFMDQKLKNYSSGMQVRLAFSIAIRAQGDILLLDEVLAVGDINFQKKCYDYFKQLKKEKKTVVLVSHDSGVLREYCTNGILLEKGQIIKEGDIASVVNEYTGILNAEAGEAVTATEANRWGSQEITVESVKMNKSKKMYVDDEPIEFEVEFKVCKPVEKPVYGITISDLSGQIVFQSNTLWRQVPTKDAKGGSVQKVFWSIPNAFNTGTYMISPAASDSSGGKVYDWHEGMQQFKVDKSQKSHGLVNLNHQLKVIEGE